VSDRRHFSNKEDQSAIFTEQDLLENAKHGMINPVDSICADGKSQILASQDEGFISWPVASPSPLPLKPPAVPAPPLTHPHYEAQPINSKADNKLRVQYLFLAIIFIAIVTYFGSNVLSDLMQEQVDGDVSLKNTIIGSWVLYKDNSGVGSYVQANADGTIKLTEVRLGEWMITPHRLVEEDNVAFLEFFDEATESWVRFIVITTPSNKELLFTYLE